MGRDKPHQPEQNRECGWEERNPRAPGRPKKEGKGGTLPPTSSYSENFSLSGYGPGKEGWTVGRMVRKGSGRPQVGLGWGALNSPG